MAGTVRDIFAAIFPELGDIQGERIRTAIKQSFIERGWDAADASLGSIAEPGFKGFVEILQSDPKPDRGLRTLLARLGELADYGFFDLAGEQESLWQSDEPIIIRIHKSQNEVLQNAFASLVFYKLYKDMFRRGTQTQIRSERCSAGPAGTARIRKSLTVESAARTRRITTSSCEAAYETA